MTRDSKNRGGMTAKELMDQLAVDPEYQGRAVARVAEQAERERELREAERPIVADLRAVGVNVNSSWDLVNTSEPYPAALPVLFRHLERGGYPDRVMEGVARALAVTSAGPYWPALAQLYRKAPGPDEREGLAVALAASATKNRVDELIELLSDRTIDDSRIHLVRPLARLGGRHGRHALEDLRTDPALAHQIDIVLDGAGQT